MVDFGQDKLETYTIRLSRQPKPSFNLIFHYRPCAEFSTYQPNSEEFPQDLIDARERALENAREISGLIEKQDSPLARRLHAIGEIDIQEKWSRPLHS